MLDSVLANGFKLVLLECYKVRATPFFGVQAKLFDGGRNVETIRHVHDTSITPFPSERLSKLLYQVISPPHFLATYGSDCGVLLHNLFGERASLFRILDLHATAVALQPVVAARARLADLFKAFSIPHFETEDTLFPYNVEQLLWAVISEADQRGLSLERLLQHAEAARHRADFSHCAFDENTLRSVPETSGVYAMYDKHDRLLYVGKSVNLRRRLSEYFTASVRLSDKIACIRSKIHHIAYHIVGSELEALLLENRLIESQQPVINVQRSIAAGRRRYTSPLLAAMVVMRSATPHYADAFVFDTHRHAYQLRFAPHLRKAPVSLRKILDHFLQGGPPPKHSGPIRDWGDVGREICLRFFARHRSRLHWCELSAGAWRSGGWQKLCEMARAALNADECPAEFRDE